MSNSPTTAVISDIHGNSPALEAVLSDILTYGIRQVYCLGDVINGMDPAGSLRLMRNWEDMVCLKGSAELYMLTPDWDGFPRKEEGLYKGLFEILGWWKAEIPSDDLEWIESWPTMLSLNGACLVHDSPVDRLAPEHRYVAGIDDKYQELMHHGPGLAPRLSDEDLLEIEEIMHRYSYSLVFAGHTHEPFVRHVDGLTICNAGSVGFNLDGNPTAAWVSVDGIMGDECHITIHRIPYDIDRTLKIVDEAGDYPSFAIKGRQQAYKQMIRTGIHWKMHMPR